MNPRYKALPLLLAAALGFHSGCFDDADDTEVGAADVGVDSDQEIPSVESIDFDGANTAEAPAKVHIESSNQRAVITSTGILNAQKFLPADQAAQLLPGQESEIADFPGQTASETYNALRYVPRQTTQPVFGVGLQIWDLRQGDTEPTARLQDLRDQFLNVANPPADDAPDGAFTSQRSGIRSYAFAGENHLFILSCDTSECQSWDALIDLGNDIASQH